MTDTAALQAIINGSSRPVIPDGHYTIGRLVIPPETLVEANRVLFIAAPGLDEPMIDMTGSHRSRWSGGHFTAAGMTGVNLKAFHVLGANDAEITGAHIIDGGQFGVEGAGGSNLRINRLTIDKTIRGGIYIQDTTNIHVSENRVLGSATYHGIQMTGGSGHLIENNYVHGSHAFNISMLRCLLPRVVGNHCEQSRLEGINVQDCDQWAILNNICSWPGTQSRSLDFGISAWGSGPYCNFGIISGNSVAASAKAGIALADKVCLTQVTNNRVLNCNVINEPDLGSASIVAYGPNSNNFFSGNHMFSNLGWTKYGITGANGNHVPVGANFSVGHTVAEVA